MESTDSPDERDATQQCPRARRALLTRPAYPPLIDRQHEREIEALNRSWRVRSRVAACVSIAIGFVLGIAGTLVALYVMSLRIDP